jgi:hypothetical protein
LTLANKQAVNEMSPDNKKRGYMKDFVLASALIAVGIVVSGLSLTELAARNPQLAQATPPLQSTPGAETKPSAPQEPATTGTRPQETPPQPARPDAQAQKEGVKPVLPAAPAEKTAAPIK